MIGKFQINNEDLIAQQESAVKHTEFHKKSRVIHLVLSIVISFYFLFLTQIMSQTMYIIVLIALLIPAFWKIYDIGMVKRLKREIKEHKNKTGDFTVTLSDERVTIESEIVTKRIGWSDIKYVTEDKERYFLYLTDLDVIILKKNPDDLDEEKSSDYQGLLRSKTAPIIIKNKTSFVDKLGPKHIIDLIAAIVLIIIAYFVFRWMFL